MKDYIRLFDLRHLVKRLKDNEVKVNAYILFLFWFILECIVTSFMIHPIFTQVLNMQFGGITIFLILPLLIVYDVFYTTFKFNIFTPKELNFKKNIVIVLALQIILNILHILNLPFDILFGIISTKIIVAIYYAMDFFIIYKIKQTYCSKGCIRIYLLFIVEIISMISYYRTY